MNNRYGGVIWTNHALQRLTERGIKQGDAWATFSRPQSSKFASGKNAWVFYRNWSGCQIEVVASQNKKKEWVILSVWSKPIYSHQHPTYQNLGFLENLVEKILQKLFGKLKKPV